MAAPAQQPALPAAQTAAQVSAPIVAIAEEEELYLNWAKCEHCGKWRTTKLKLQESDHYLCSDTTVTRLPFYALCEAPLEPGAEGDD
jgi:hypothetical protein